MVGYYGESNVLRSRGLIAVEFNFKHLCWVEVCWKCRDSQWEAFQAAVADLQLDIPLGELTEEEINELTLIGGNSSDKEGQESTNTFNEPRCHKHTILKNYLSCH